MATRRDRRLATVLFLDIVESTRIAAEVGDRRWRELIREFRARVRAVLRRHHGHEQDTAGDGFFATFDRPEDAVRSALAIVGSVQQLGLDVRVGLHSGALERIDGRLGGIAAHIGARVMAGAGPAEIAATTTVRDLVLGDDLEFAPGDERALRGVPGVFGVHRLLAVEGDLVPPPLPPEDAEERLARQQPDHGSRPLLAGVVGVALLALAVGTGLFLRQGGEQQGSAPTASAVSEVTMLKIDPAENKVVGKVRDRHLSVGSAAPVAVVDGTLWQITPISIVRRDVTSGEAVDVIDLPRETWSIEFGFGSIWAGSLNSDGDDIIHRINPTSGRVIASVVLEERVEAFTVGRRAMWLLTAEQELLELDPNSNEIVDRDIIPSEGRLEGTVQVGDLLWLCECGFGRLVEFNPTTDEVTRTIAFTQRGFVLPDARVSSQGAPVTTEQDTVWLLDADGGTITPVEAQRGEAGSSLGIPRRVSGHAFGFGSLWLAGGDGVHRVALDSGESRSIEIPDGLVTGGVALDEPSGVVWVSACVPAVSLFPGADPCRLAPGN